MIGKEILMFIYKKMIEIRRFEEAAIKTYKQKLWKGSLHACIGQEAIPASAAAVINPDDYFISNHRGHGHIIAKGVDPSIFMAELFGRLEGNCHGRGGSMHMMDAEKRVYPHGLVGSGAYIAAGIGFKINYMQTNEVVICFLGDGSTNTGGFHEGVNMAALWKTPVVFICENNGIGVSTKTETIMPIPNISQRAIGYGIKGITVDGTDVLVLHDTIKKAVDEARYNKQPMLIEAVCQRAVGHTAWDPAKYRSIEENNRWRYYDPIKRLKEYILGEKLYKEEEINTWESEIQQIIDNAVKFAKEGKTPEYTREEAYKFVYV